MVDIKDPENTIIITLKDGDVVIQLLPDVAPKHVERMKELARAGAYDNVAFHRVIDGFMAQTGDVEHANMKRTTTRAALAPVGPTSPICLQNFPRCRTPAAHWVRHVPPAPIRPTASSLSASKITIS